MKTILELGLELIELEDQVLLVDRDLNKGGDTMYYLNGFIGRLYSNPQYQSYDILDFDGTLLERVRIKSNEVPYRIIASTKPLEGLPLLVIEDESAKEMQKWFLTTKNEQADPVSFFKGYDKARQTYKFTEEDLRKVIELARECDSDCGGIYWENGVEYIIQSLTKKELWIEVEEWSLAENVEAKNQNVPKIINNQIKATYK